MRPSVLKPDLLAKLKVRLKEPPADGGLWTSGKVANWMAQQLGLTALASQRGWEALQAIGWSIQSPRPKNPKSATPEEAEVFKKVSARLSAKKSTNIPTSRSRSGPRMSIGSA
jgi:transposase